MRFRAKITNKNLITLQSIISRLHLLGENSVIYLNEETVKFACACDNIDSPRCFAELKAMELFSEYRIESQSSNTILFEVNVENFSRALTSGKSAPICQLKLAKRGNKPCLCFEGKAMEGLSVDVVHDIPIKILKATEIVYHMPPEVPLPTVALDLPHNKFLRNIVDRFAKMTKHLIVTASQTGRIVFQVEHGTATVRTFYNGLQPRFEAHLEPALHIDNCAEVTIDSKKFATVLALCSLPLERATICEYCCRLQTMFNPRHV